MGEIMKGIQKQIMEKDPFPIDQLVIAKGTEYNGTKLTEALTLSASNPKDLMEIKKLMGLKEFPTHAASGICFSFVNFMNQKANGIEMRSFEQWYIDNVKDGRIGYGETQGGSQGVFEGTADINPKTNDKGKNASDGVNYGRYYEPIRDETNLTNIKEGINQLKNSQANTAILHVHYKKDNAGDHFITVIRNKETGQWEAVDHNLDKNGQGWGTGKDIFNEEGDLIRNIRRITYVD
ncbi:hypothetical protein EHQ23_08090 [Leptospira bourretii]|uniref:Uncharacterized protein n=2 Tax=Leptospira bourretii TaxID=2484962 RepID=A0A4R9IU10_9LEPT|nr:hypothetical protein EHQ23_08090 [Leptospira bourretii]TGK94982.1 hypothetical protein EHQ26_00090 [Leptospira bourretii]TGL42482.1 hypothetical protein EHQ45_02435 [Leptospira bourretii]